jgi:glycosyltransferase involved in cell wall biosynthesis
MIRVATVIDALGRGGAERLLVDTARLIDRSRFAVQVHTVFPVRRDYEGALRELGVTESCLGLSGMRGLPAAALRLAQAWRHDPPHLVHTHLFGANVVGRLAARLSGLPVLSTLHDADYEPVVRLGNPGLTPLKQHFLRAVDGFTAAFSRCRVVCVSQYVATAARRRLRVPEVRIDVIPNAVDTHRFGPDERARSAMRARLGLAPLTATVAHVGRLTPQKGVEVLLRATRDLVAGGRDLRVLVVGDGFLRSRLERLAIELQIQDRVEFLGVRSDVPEILRAADVLALPSLHEGFGLVLVEALASGVPVVASRTGPMPEIVWEGETGLLFEPGDARDLARALDRLLGDPAMRRRMGRKGREDALARFSLPTMVHRLESLYERVVSESRARTP